MIMYNNLLTACTTDENETGTHEFAYILKKKKELKTAPHLVLTTVKPVLGVFTRLLPIKHVSCSSIFQTSATGLSPLAKAVKIDRSSHCMQCPTAPSCTRTQRLLTKLGMVRSTKLCLTSFTVILL